MNIGNDWNVKSCFDRIQNLEAELFSFFIYGMLRKIKYLETLIDAGPTKGFCARSVRFIETRLEYELNSNAK